MILGYSLIRSKQILIQIMSMFMTLTFKITTFPFTVNYITKFYYFKIKIVQFCKGFTLSTYRYSDFSTINTTIAFLLVIN